MLERSTICNHILETEREPLYFAGNRIYKLRHGLEFFSDPAKRDHPFHKNLRGPLDFS